MDALAAYADAMDALARPTSDDRWAAEVRDGIDVNVPGATVRNNLVQRTGGEDDYATGRFTAFRYDPADRTSLSNDNVTTLFEDRGGVLWVQTDVSATMQRETPYARLGNNQLLACNPVSGEVRIRGIFSVTQIARQLGDDADLDVGAALPAGRPQRGRSPRRSRGRRG